MRAAKARIFVDTNIFVYAYDTSAAAKRDAASAILRRLWAKRNGVLSTQVVQEFYVAVTRKIPHPLAPETARAIAADLLLWDTVAIDGAAILEAIDLQARLQVSFWDALIVQAALRGRAGILLSEDFTDGRKIEGLEILNPFKRRVPLD